MSISASIQLTALARLRRAGWLARVAALAGIVAVLLQGALPIAHQATAHQLQLATSDPLYADYLAAFGDETTIYLCGTENAASGDKPTKPGPSHRLPSCPLCMAAQHASGFLPPVGVAMPIPAQGPKTVATVVVTVRRAVGAATDAQARAPPQAI